MQRKTAFSVTMLIAMLFLEVSISAQTVMAFKTGEQVTGNTKQCIYQFAGNIYTRTLAAYQLCPMNIEVQPLGSVAQPMQTAPYQSTATGFKTGEQITGNTKQCFYNYLGNTYIKTVPSYAMCPMSITIQH